MPTQSHLVKQTLPIHAITDVQASRGGLRMVRNVSGYGHLIRQNCQLWNPNIPNHVPPKGQIHWCSRSWVPMPVHSEGLQKVRKLSETKLKCWCLAGSRVSRAHRTKCANHCKSIYYFDWKISPFIFESTHGKSSWTTRAWNFKPMGILPSQTIKHQKKQRIWMW